MGECDVSGCTNQAVTVIVGEAGDLWLCVKHRQPEPEQIDGSESGVTSVQIDGRVSPDSDQTGALNDVEA